MKDCAPLILAAIPFGIIYGALGQSTELTAWAVVAMSVFVFAGSSQFIAVGLLASGAAWPVVVLTTFFVNFRHLLYSANLLPHVKPYSQSIRAPMAFLLTDESFAVASNYLTDHGKQENFHWYYFGAALFMYLNWQVCTLVGLFIGQSIPDMANWGLDMAMVVAFIGIVVPCLHNRATLACALTAGALSLITYDWPHKTGLLFSAVAAILVAMYLEAKSAQQTNAVGRVEQGANK
ncbi:branched-chain amino acid ABC transporter permease [Thalassotalea euphylliae]|uniref:Branched-chain amino acid ABC transporter permease n=2 Tax=Thalassotalea euphylliae TaxID=1655234 RepID=A0A3E0TX65_9GAMM|nr:branched-chain amino acid ABC transporter permease [Thalassotalea euphylliae]